MIKFKIITAVFFILVGGTTTTVLALADLPGVTLRINNPTSFKAEMRSLEDFDLIVVDEKTFLELTFPRDLPPTRVTMQVRFNSNSSLWQTCTSFVNPPIHEEHITITLMRNMNNTGFLCRGGIS